MDERIGTTTDCPDCGQSQADCARGHNRDGGECCTACTQNTARERNHRIRIVSRGN